MKNHTRIYLDYFGYGMEDFIPCEICGSRANDIHHIHNRKMGGVGKAMDYIENLMALCREHHDLYGDKPIHREWLINKHNEFMQSKNRI